MAFEFPLAPFVSTLLSGANTVVERSSFHKRTAVTHCFASPPPGRKTLPYSRPPLLPTTLSFFPPLAWPPQPFTPLGYPLADTPTLTIIAPCHPLTHP